MVQFHKEGVLDTALEILNECQEDLQVISNHDLSWIKTHTDIKETIKRNN